jgi:hypothetical protein
MKLLNPLRATACLMLWALNVATAQETLILAPDHFLSALQPLKQFKDATCRPARLIGLTQVYTNYAGADEAERVKRCIAHYRQTFGVDYVVLVGDVDQFPARYRWWGLTNQENWAVSDLYYADLYKSGTTTFDDWDANNNGLYGEIEFAPDGFINNDNIDFLPDVAVGRIPASNVAEVNAYVRKAIGYELWTTESAAWFKRAGLYTGDWNVSDNTIMDQIAASLSNEAFALTKRYWDWQNNQAPAGVPGVITNDVNAGVGFMSYIGHGNSGAWASLGFGTGQLLQLTNTSRLPVVFAASCDTSYFAPFGRMHPYLDVNGTGHWGTANGENLPPGPYPHTSLPHPACVQTGGVWNAGNYYRFDQDCLGESFLFGLPAGGSGCVAYLGERSGGQITSRELNQQFFGAYDSGLRFLGDLWNSALREYYTNHNLGAANTWWRTADHWADGHVFDEPQKFHLFGDPSLVVGGAFSTALSGAQSDWPWPMIGPLHSLSRYGVTGDITVPAGQRLTAQYYHTLLFENGRKVVALDASPANGLVVNASTAWPVHFLGTPTGSPTTNWLRGIKVTGQMRLRNGGAVKLHAGP